MNLFVLAGIIVGVSAVSVGLLWLARRSPLNERFSSQLGEHSRAFDFLGIAFAILLGFVVLQAYDSYNEAKSGAEQEAQSILELTRTAAAFTPEEHERLEGALVCYGRAVIEQGWPAMSGGGEGSPVVTDWGRVFREQAFELDVGSVIQQEAFRQLLLEQDRRIEGRRVRLAEAVRVTPAPLWFVLVLGATLTVGWIVLGADRRGSFLVQASAVASVAAMATATLLLVWFLDHPFENQAGSIRPIEMEAVLEVIDEESEAEGIEVAPPCTESGDPLGESATARSYVLRAPPDHEIAPSRRNRA
jgi:hypothetical protein